jgi:hypothetical protein
MNTPVALMIFNRPETTRAVFREIARAKPPRLLVVADGPRPGRPAEADRCAEARAVIEQIDWDCIVTTDFSEENLGCRRRVSSGLDWIFTQVESCIILEDDCMPHPDFFSFCETLLEQYRDDERVMAIGGDNFSPGRRWGEGSYYFSRYSHIWGWATWRRAWRHYDVSMAGYRGVTEATLAASGMDAAERRHWAALFEATQAGAIDTWDYQWQYAIMQRHGLTIVPNVNLVSNIGFGPEATHTKTAGDPVSALPVQAIGMLRHPKGIRWDAAADRYVFRRLHGRSLTQRLYRGLARGIRAWSAPRLRMPGLRPGAGPA